MPPRPSPALHMDLTPAPQLPPLLPPLYLPLLPRAFKGRWYALPIFLGVQESEYMGFGVVPRYVGPQPEHLFFKLWDLPFKFSNDAGPQLSK